MRSHQETDGRPSLVARRRYHRENISDRHSSEELLSRRVTSTAENCVGPSERDVHEGRTVLDLSRWQFYTADSQADLLTRIASEARSGGMPLKQYLLIHPDNHLRAEEQQQIYDWEKAERTRIRQQLSDNLNKPAVNSRTEIP